MALYAWPGDLPQFALEQGFSLKLSDNTRQTSMDSGPAKTRRRVTADTSQFDITIACTQEQLASFRAFYRDTLKDGALPFDWVDPTTRPAMTFQFVRPPPSVAAFGGMNFNVSMRLQRVPS